MLWPAETVISIELLLLVLLPSICTPLVEATA